MEREDSAGRWEIGYLADGKAARKLLSFLQRKGVDAHLSFDGSSRRHFLWTAGGEDLPRAREYYRIFLGLAVPSRYQDSPLADALAEVPLGTATLVLMLASVVCWAIVQFGLVAGFADALLISGKPGEFLPEIWAGQIWRLLTPIFLHFGFLHIFFNMLVFKKFSSTMEHSFGSGFFLAFLIASALVSNFFQYLLGGGNFGGMSGVVFAQLSFFWSYKKCRPSYPYGLSNEVFVGAVVWFVLCLFGVLFFRAANFAHAAGLAVGIFASLIWARQFSLSHISLALGILSASVAVEYFSLFS